MKTFLHSTLNTKNSALLVFLFSLLVFTGCEQNLSAPPDYNITLYAATYAKGIYETSNGGKSWYPLDLDHRDLYMHFKRIYQDPTDKDLIYVTTTGAGLFIINLLDWTIEKRASFSDENINSIAFLKSSLERDKDLLMIGFENIGVFRTISEYEIWQPFNNGLNYRDISVVFANEGNMYAGTNKNFYKYDNKSQTWVSASNGLKNKNIYSIDADARSDTLYVGSGPYGGGKGYFDKIACFYISTDQGDTWRPSSEGIPDGTLIYNIAVNKNKPERIYVGTSDGLYRSTDSGETWKKMKQGLPGDIRVLDIKIAHMNNGTDVVYASSTRGVFMTVDDDKYRWVSKNYNLPQTITTSIIIAPNKGNE